MELNGIKCEQCLLLYNTAMQLTSSKKYMKSGCHKKATKKCHGIGIRPSYTTLSFLGGHTMQLFSLLKVRLPLFKSLTSSFTRFPTNNAKFTSLLRPLYSIV